MANEGNPWRAVSAVGLAAAILASVGCSSGSKPGSTPGSSDRAGSSASEAVAEDDGPKPDVILLVSGQQLGYLEPCGCTEGQSGGLGRRADLMSRLRADGTPLVPLDLGSLISDPAASRGGPEQERIKLGIGLEALARLGYQAMALGAEDLEVGISEYVGQHFNVPDAPPVVVTNATPVEGFEELFRPRVTVEAGPLTVGVLAVVDPEAIASLGDPEFELFLSELRDPIEAARDALPELEAESDVQVVLVQGPSDLARSVAEAMPEVEVVVGRSEFDSFPMKPELFHDGGTTLVLVGKKGQQVGLVDLFEGDGARPRYRRVPLDLRYEDAEPIRSLLAEEYLVRLDQNDVLENFPRRPHPSGATFVGAETCKACHPNTFEKWSGTRHAFAWPAIETGRRGNRTMDAECVSCHSTGFGFETGFVNAAQTPHLKGQQCENCHGPGSRHVSDPMNPEYREHVRVTLEQAERSLCIRCHDSDNDPHWDFAKRWPDVVHSGLDRYDDPATRTGLDPALIPGPEADGEAD
ncbi:multiheme c-type cytochrome [Tautonia sociabilis]|uniref:Cytochrome c-552/4 domain-containing protein n=1 Tax=Tautonia sociabilis TaxID=2080755 RepID=A0A432MKN4_9BACT|nr:multiheme c-type cytochrome [Tautonia sociabilis]RUL87695.1 hypothetical protein TsocGM_10940 [Tautonia sociabilis]